MAKRFSLYKAIGIFPDAKGPLTLQYGRIWQNFQLIRDFMVVLVTCKNEEDPIENKCKRVATSFKFIFSDAQGQITLKSVVGSGQNTNSFQLVCMSSLPTS